MFERKAIDKKTLTNSANVWFIILPNVVIISNNISGYYVYLPSAFNIISIYLLNTISNLDIITTLKLESHLVLSNAQLAVQMILIQIKPR